MDSKGLPQVGMQGRTGDIGQPVCKKCGFPQISVNGLNGCAKCDKPEASANKKFIVKTKDGRTLKFNTENDMLKALGYPENKKKIINPKVAQELARETIPSQTPTMNVKLAFELIDRQVREMKFESIGDAKKILSLRKKINNLKFEIDNLIGG